ncbi:response regulator [Lacrimispora celerecrescens]|uniref:response regulator n=1 Tax=Lacrimispora celerecrescens TaxID=29354 RepID=UPI000A6A685D|nr:response regulator [Lacrimispora celerecrescens]
MLKSSKNVLVVDDEPKILEVVCLLLESKGFRTFPAENGSQALEIFDSENISLVILDLMMPDISGEEVCIAIRKKSRVPIIMLTAKVDEGDVVDGLGLGGR